MVGFPQAPVIVLAATNRPEAMDIALRRGGRFEREIAVGIPDQSGRAKIIQVQASKLRLSGDFDYTTLAHDTPGWVGADLAALTKEAAILATNRIFGEMAAKASDGLENHTTCAAAVNLPVLLRADALKEADLMRREATNDLLRSLPPMEASELESLAITMDVRMQRRRCRGRGRGWGWGLNDSDLINLRISGRLWTMCNLLRNERDSLRFLE